MQSKHVYNKIVSSSITIWCKPINANELTMIEEWGF